MISPRKVAIVGASASGVGAAVAMRNSGFVGEISLIDAGEHLPYERPPLSKSLANGRAELKDILAPASYDELDIALHLGVRVASIDPARQSLTFADSTTHHYDSVLLATGLSPRRLEVPGADLENVLYLRTAEDAAQIAHQLALGGPLVIIGGGFIGLELAAVARSAGIAVTVIEFLSLPLLRATGPEVAALFRELHIAQGVRLLTDASVARLRGAGGVEEVVLQDGRVIPAQTVVAGIGVIPNDELAQRAGIECTGGIPVDDVGRTGNPWLWATGDVAVRDHRHSRRRGRIEHWDTAQRHGAVVGRSMVGDPAEESSVPFIWSDQYALTYQAFGLREPGDTIVLRRGFAPDKFMAFWLSEGRVRATAGIGHSRELRAARSLIESGEVVDAVLLESPDADLRLIARAR